MLQDLVLDAIFHFCAERGFSIVNGMIRRMQEADANTAVFKLTEQVQ